jgi:enoyl-CoA hydratase/carnithine racemase
MRLSGPAIGLHQAAGGLMVRLRVPAAEGDRAACRSDRADLVAVVTLNRPARRNAVSLAMWRELELVFRRLSE